MCGALIYFNFVMYAVQLTRLKVSSLIVAFKKCIINVTLCSFYYCFLTFVAISGVQVLTTVRPKWFGHS